MGFTSPDAEVAAKVRAELAYQQRAQGDLALALGLTQPSISRRLAGHRSFSVEELVAVARFLGKPLADFLPTEAVPA